MARIACGQQMGGQSGFERGLVCTAHPTAWERQQRFGVHSTPYRLRGASHHSGQNDVAELEGGIRDPWGVALLGGLRYSVWGWFGRWVRPVGRGVVWTSLDQDRLEVLENWR